MQSWSDLAKAICRERKARIPSLSECTNCTGIAMPDVGLCKACWNAVAEPVLVSMADVLTSLTKVLKDFPATRLRA